jgi:membrane protease YdiL (CAAX protease family)
MVDQLSPPNACRMCGASLNTNRMSTESTDGLCEMCVQNKTVSWNPMGNPTTVAPYQYQQYDENRPDPDRPEWGPMAGIGMWLFSTAAIIFIPAILLVGWIFLDRARGIEPPLDISQENIPPRYLLVGIYSTLIAHLVTLAFCWAVVTKLKTRPFLKSLGWDWAGRSGIYWFLISIGIIISIIAADQFFIKVLPQKETSFDKVLQSSQHVRLAVALLAVISAPFIEEVIYRGILYGGLRKRFGTVATVIGVTLLFASVHVPQYYGAWASMAGLTMLSLILTIVRAKTKSILPCVMIHFVNNFFFSILIVLNKA